MSSLAPPAPEGWDKGCHPITLSAAPPSSRKYRYPLHVFVSRYRVVVTVGIVKLVVSVSVVSRCYLMLVPRLSSRPSPPAPEGWDKDITAKTNTHSHHLYTHHLGSICAPPLSGLPGCCSTFISFLLLSSSLGLSSCCYPCCTLVQLAALSLAPGPGGLG